MTSRNFPCLHTGCPFRCTDSYHLRRHLRGCGRAKQCQICIDTEDLYECLRLHQSGRGAVVDRPGTAAGMVTHRRPQRLSSLSQSTRSSSSRPVDASLSPLQKVREYLHTLPAPSTPVAPEGEQEVVRDEITGPGLASQNEVEPIRAEAPDQGSDEPGPPVLEAVSPRSQASSLASKSVTSVPAISQLRLSVSLDDMGAPAPVTASTPLAPLVTTVSAAPLTAADSMYIIQQLLSQNQRLTQHQDRMMDEVRTLTQGVQTLTQALREAQNNSNRLCKEVLDHRVQMYHNGGYVPVNVPTPGPSGQGSGQLGVMPAGWVDFGTIETHAEEVFEFFRPSTPQPEPSNVVVRSKAKRKGKKRE